MMTLAQAGDSVAYQKLLRDITLYVKPILRRKLGDPAHTDDVTQDILLSIHKARHTYDSSRAFLPWVHAIIHFRVNDQLRKIYAGRKFEELDLDADYSSAVQESQTSEAIDAPLLQALDSLPEKQRLAVEKLKLEGLSVKEAAKAAAMSESALKVNAHRAYKAMRIFLNNRMSADA